MKGRLVAIREFLNNWPNDGIIYVKEKAHGPRAQQTAGTWKYDGALLLSNQLCATDSKESDCPGFTFLFCQQRADPFSLRP